MSDVDRRGSAAQERSLNRAGIVDARLLADGDAIVTDVAVVGAGPAGITLAESWIGAGFDVLLIESGYANERPRPDSLLGGQNLDDRYYRLNRSRARAFGGTATWWKQDRGVRLRPLDPLDFQARPEVGRGGWPIDGTELAPWYRKAAGMMGLSSADFDVRSGVDATARPLDLDADGVGTALFRFAPKADYPRRLEKLAASTNTTVLLGATASELVPHVSGRTIEALTVITDVNTSLRIRARIYVLAAGGIENARILLASAVGRGGLNGGNDRVGRYFMEHPHVRTGIIDPPPSSTARCAAAFYSLRRVDGESVIGMLTLHEEVMRREELLNSAWWLRPRDRRLATPVGAAIADLQAAHREYGRVVTGTTSRAGLVTRQPLDSLRAVAATLGLGPSTDVLQLAVMAEQEPSSESRVVLGRHRDRLGRPLAAVRWSLSALDFHTIHRTEQLIASALQKRGFGQLQHSFNSESPPALVGGGFHHMGTTRMASSAANGVVDEDCCAHDFSNMYITGSSVFPSVGYANPTLTIVALAARLAHHVSSQLRQ